jgi:hypothetical protein
MTLIHRVNQLTRAHPITTAVIFSQVMAVIWWIAAQVMNSTGVNVWHDQIYTFRESAAHFFEPYQIIGFVALPWAVVALAPFALLPLAPSILLQACLYFALITLFIFKFKGDVSAVVLTLTSFIALDAVLEMNFDWAVMIGLVIPVTWSSPFLLLKPQLALGYYFGVPPKEWWKIALVTLAMVTISVLIWGNWFGAWLNGAGDGIVDRMVNVAPSQLIGYPIALIIGVVLAWQSFRRKDPLLGIIAWIFFTPYLAMYSLLLGMAIISIRFRLLAVIAHIAMWIILGGIYVISLMGVAVY